MGTFKAIIVPEKGQPAALGEFDEAALMDGDVTVAVEYSTVNYKDGLAITGKAPVVRRFPMIPGIDFAGKVESSSHPDFKAGDSVVLNGWGTGETHLGAYGAKSRVKGDWLVKLPAGMTPREAMAIGTAGYTAMLCVIALEKYGIKPADGQIVVTGAAGGVGSVAIALLSKLGYAVAASTGRASEADYLKSLGASEIIDRAEFSAPAKPLGKERFAGGVDSVGSHTLANVLSMTKYGGAVAACGLGGGHGSACFGRTLHPAQRFAARRGFRHVPASRADSEAWKRLASELDRKQTRSHDHRNSAGGRDRHCAPKILAGQVRGRTVVKVGG
jgi:acrylyl-CoA reductase (NADPH)